MEARKQWSLEDSGRLVRLKKVGATDSQISAILDRSIQAVSSRATLLRSRRDIRPEYPVISGEWKQSEIDLMLQLKEQGKATKLIAFGLCRSPRAVEQKLYIVRKAERGQEESQAIPEPKISTSTQLSLIAEEKPQIDIEAFIQENREVLIDAIFGAIINVYAERA